MTDTPYELWCLVKGDTAPFDLIASSDESIVSLKRLIRERRKIGVLRGFDAEDLTLAKVDVDFKTHTDEIHSGKYKPITYDRLDEWSTVAEVWPVRPPNRHLHIFVIPPQADELSEGSVTTGTYEPHITVHITGENFARQDIELNGINEIGNPDFFPDFFQKFLERLDRKRPGHPILMTEWVFKHVDKEVLMKHFDFEDTKADFALGAELGHYLYAICSNNQRKCFFKQSKELYTQRLLVDLADELALISSNKGICRFNTSWPFHLVVERGKGSRQFAKYTPKSNFSMLVRELPHCLLEVSSNPRKETDRWRMLLQASCLARLAANKLRKNGSSNPPIIMAIYINEAMEAEEYLFFKDDGSDEVRYRTQIFNLTSPTHALQFVFRLYNFITFMVDVDSELSDALNDRLMDAKAEVSAKGYETFTAAQRKYDGNDSSSHNTRSSPEGQQRQRSAFEDPAMQTTLEDAGYVLIPELSDDPIKNPLGLKPVTPLKPTIRRATSANGVSVILKLLDDDTDELTFLRYFKENNAIANHIIDLIGVLDLSVGTVVSFPEGTRLDEGLRFGVFPDAVGSLRIQFLEGVAFLHEHKVAHLDLNPNNVIVSGARSPSRRLSIIDFGLSMIVEDENTVTRGYRGTRGWVAPEIGTLNGPATTYSAMGADRWACGRMIDYFGKYIRVEDRSLNMEMGRWSVLLLSENVRMRPSLREVLSGHRTAGDDRAKRKTNVDGLDLTHKRARLSEFALELTLNP